MKIIAISRQFGSGGRELGRRLSEILGFDYYDKEIIEMIAKDNGLNKDFVDNIVSNHSWQNIPITFSRSFIGITGYESIQTSMWIKQKETIEKIAQRGKDCIIVGRDADVILSEYKPLRIFICADKEHRIQRCMKYEIKNNTGASEKEVEKMINQIDKNRSRVRELVTSSSWGKVEDYDLLINTTNKNAEDLAPMVADFIRKWFN